MPFSNNIMAAMLIVAFIGIVILARLIARQIEKISSKRIGGITYLVVAALAVYYLIDVLLSSDSILSNTFFYFWLLLVIVAVVMFWRNWIRHGKITQMENEDRME